MAEERTLQWGDTVRGEYDKIYPGWNPPPWALDKLEQRWLKANPMSKDWNEVKAGQKYLFPTSSYPAQFKLRGEIKDKSRLSAEEYILIATALNRSRSTQQNQVNALRRLSGKSGTFKLPTSGVSSSLLKTVTDATDEEVLNQILHMQDREDLMSGEEQEKWFDRWGFDPSLAADVRKGWEDREKFRRGGVKHEREVLKEEERVTLDRYEGWLMQVMRGGEVKDASESLVDWIESRGIDSKYFEGLRKLADSYFTQIGEQEALSDKRKQRSYDAAGYLRNRAYGEASQEIIPQSGNVYVPGQYTPMEALNRMLAKLAAIGTKDADIRNLEASLRAKMTIYQKNVDGTMDESLTRISNDIIDRLQNGELTGSKAIAEYSSRAKGFPTPQRNAGISVIKDLVSQVKYEGGAAKREAELTLAEAKVSDLEADPHKRRMAINIIQGIVKRVRDGDLEWGEADNTFKEAMLAQKDDRTIDAAKLNKWSTYLENQIKDFKPKTQQEQVIRLNRWTDLATRGDKGNDQYRNDLTALDFQIRDRLTGIGGITPGMEARDYAATFGRELLTVILTIPPAERLGVWNWFEAQSPDKRLMLQGATGRPHSDGKGGKPVWNFSEYLKQVSAAPLPGSTEVVEALVPAGFTRIESGTLADGTVVKIGMNIPDNTSPEKMSKEDRWGQLSKLDLSTDQKVAIMLGEGYTR
jgi:hypothetical protein